MRAGGRRLPALPAGGLQLLTEAPPVLVKPRLHRVALPQTEVMVATVATCVCGWRIGYDPAHYARAVAAAYAHCEDEALADLEAGPELAP